MSGTVTTVKFPSLINVSGVVAVCIWMKGEWVFLASADTNFWQISQFQGTTILMDNVLSTGGLTVRAVLTLVISFFLIVYIYFP